MQTKAESLMEAVVNILIGFWINFWANFVILPLFGFSVSLSQTFWIGVMFTAISIVRSYIIRRWAQQYLRASIIYVRKKIIMFCVHIQALCFALALSRPRNNYALNRADQHVDTIYEFVSCMRIPDEEKANLYATLVEKIPVGTPLTKAREVISAALREINHV